MRKHFLILMLMALLPLSTWAADVEVRVYGSEQHFDYGAVTVPDAGEVSVDMVSFIPSTLSDDAKAAVVAKLQFAYTDAALTAESVPGNYEFTVSLISAGDRTISGLTGDENVYTIVIGDPDGSFVVDKATAPVPTVAPALVAGTVTYNGESQKLADGGTAPDGFELEYSTDGTNWTDNGAFATAANETGYTIYYRTKGKTYYNPSATQNLGDLNKKAIAKAAITLNGGTAATGLAFDGTAKQLLTAGVTASGFTPTLVYTVDKFGATEYNNTYNVIEPANAYADVKVTNQGKYRVKCDISDEDKANLTVTAKVIADIVVAKGSPIKVAPAALNPSYTNAEQPLISTGTAVEGATILYCATNSDTPGDWTTTVPKGTYATGHDDGTNPAVAYTAWYKVAADDVNGNWDAVPATQITGVTIEKAIVTVKVNNISKVYDGTTSLDNATIDGGNPKFTFITLKAGDDAADFAGINYSAVEAVNAKASAYTGVVTVSTDDFTAINDNYAYYVQPGNLTINKAQLTITATSTNAAYGAASAATILEAYTIKDQNDADVAVANAFQEGKFPKLTSAQAVAAEFKPGSYDVAFTPGTLKTDGNYEMSTAGENEDGYVIGAAKFTIGKAPQVIITVIPKSVQYGTTEDWTTTPVIDEDYYVANLLPNDQISNISLTREGYATEQFDANTYALTATATIAHPEWYENDGAIIFNNSTFKITPRKLTATIDQQIIVKDVTTTFDATLWDVTPMQFNQAKTVLNATLALAGGAAASLGENPQGIVLTIDNPNYMLDGDNVEGGKAYGKLIVIDDATLALNPNDANMVASINTAAGNATQYKITFIDQTKATYEGATTTDDRFTKTLKKDQWNTLVLPFNTTVEEVSAALGYAVVDVLDESNTKANTISLKLAFGDLPAHKPFLVQPKANKKLSEVDFWNSDSHKKALVAVPTTGAKAEDGAEHAFVGQYTDYKVMPNATNEYFYSSSEKGFKNSTATNGTWINVFGAYLVDGSNNARVITIQEADGSTTAISTINADGVAVPAEGWYTLNGVKLQGVPTQKGIYIHNGKKLVVK